MDSRRSADPRMAPARASEADNDAVGLGKNAEAIFRIDISVKNGCLLKVRRLNAADHTKKRSRSRLQIPLTRSIFCLVVAV